MNIPEDQVQHTLGSPDIAKGLGLWLARLFLVRMGGRIGVWKTQVGQGTTIRVILPNKQ